MKEPSNLIGQKYLTIYDMCEVAIQTEEPFYTREATERLVKILDSTYTKVYLEQLAANATHMNAEERTQLIRLLK